QILDEAGRQMRMFGFGGVSIGKIMSKLGLTHGGFYAHFKSKAALFDAMLGQDFDFTIQLNRLKKIKDLSDSNRALLASTYYLDPSNSSKVAPACTLASSTQDAARQGLNSRKSFTTSFRRLLAEYQDALPEKTDERKRKTALTALATCVGGLVLARALADKELEAELLNACSDEVVRLVQPT
ncbi:MAG: TetR/AcrR family transcriptional regulator, partial [Pseudomonadota bacterium]